MMESIALFGTAWATLIMGAIALSFPGIIVVARQQTILAIAAGQSAACGAAAAMFLIGFFGGAHLHGDVRIHFGALVGGLLGTAIGWQGSSERAGWLFAATSAGAILLVANSPFGMHDILALQHSNALTATLYELIFFIAATIVTAGALCFMHRSIRLVAIDPMHAKRCGIRTGRWNIVLGTWLGVLLSIAVSTFGLLFTFSCLVIPTLVAACVSPTSWLLFFLAPAVALLAGLGGISLGHFYDLPPGQTTAAVLAGALPLAYCGRFLVSYKTKKT